MQNNTTKRKATQNKNKLFVQRYFKHFHTRENNVRTLFNKHNHVWKARHPEEKCVFIKKHEKRLLRKVRLLCDRHLINPREKPDAYFDERFEAFVFG